MTPLLTEGGDPVERQSSNVVVSLAGALTKAGAFAAALILVSITAFTLIEIALRMMRGSGTNVVVEFTGYGLAGMTFLAAGATMREGGFVRVSILVERLPQSVRRICDVICVLMTIFTIGIFAWYVSADMWRSFQRGYETDSLVALPLWLPPAPLLIGMAVFLLDMSVLLVQILAGSANVADESPEVI